MWKEAVQYNVSSKFNETSYLLNRLCEAELSCCKLTVIQLVRNGLSLTEPKGSLPCSQYPATAPSPEAE
jgi:hypothetical protein